MGVSRSILCGISGKSSGFISAFWSSVIISKQGFGEAFEKWFLLADDRSDVDDSRVR